jgi:hypothetical protein
MAWKGASENPLKMVLKMLLSAKKVVLSLDNILEFATLKNNLKQSSIWGFMLPKDKSGA